MSIDSLDCLPWFALYIKTRHEKNVALALQGRGLESFLPTLRNIHNSGKKFDVPLFPGYVFCRIKLPDVLPVLAIPGVFSIVGTSQGPQPIPESEINAIQHMVASGLTAYPWPYIPAGREVRLNSGPLRGFSGVVVDSSDHKWLVLSVHILRRSVAVKVHRQFLSMGAVSIQPETAMTRRSA